MANLNLLMLGCRDGIYLIKLATIPQTLKVANRMSIPAVFFANNLSSYLEMKWPMLRPYRAEYVIIGRVHLSFNSV